ncbi:hypothetical protein PHLGIDRAFT_101287 [Phlebiopsis gigantea 11061_1 CR5-6]|uniref:Peroxisomal membrane protein PMP47B n=1 Tax=Phlebiopsis gigantea (strain 11061_1 CR5-6) TaxID=745531 RepID=A0A0C3PSM7_PHLG1|nr:hypothetical protein PHLGIDRAFT_101287 [Phlebiopsis gigantea 11061_1 CR5-6]
MVNDSLIHAMAGAVGGMVATTATYPLTVVFTRASTEEREQKVGLDGEEVKPKKMSDFGLLLHLLRKEPARLFDGVESNLAAIMVTNGLYYFFYENMRDFLLKSRKGTKALSTRESMLAGLVAGSATTILSNPIWVIQANQVKQGQSSTPDAKHLSFFETALKLYGGSEVKPGSSGLQNFWRGIGPALVLVINPIIQYTIFEQLKNVLIKRRTAKLRAVGGALATAVAVLSDWDYFLLGALSKLVATGSTYPYIVLKNRLQAGNSSTAQYKSAVHGIISIVNKEGIRGLYTGVASKLLQSVLTAAILFAGQKRIYELTKQVLTAAPALK